jgi:pyruvate/2-oxoglutarate dehydrogenase complex dihydrolipoamide dehydrogenase (E3) component
MGELQYIEKKYDLAVIGSGLAGLEVSMDRQTK